MIDLMQALLSGLALGGVYALVALGFSITQTTTKTLNFGQGEFLMAGAFLGVSVVLLMSGKGLHDVLVSTDVTALRYVSALLICVLALAALGTALYFSAIRPFLRQSGMSWVMSTIGFGILVQNGALLLWGPTATVLPSPLGEAVVRVAGAGIRAQEILVIGVCAIVVVGLDLLQRKTKFGKAMRAVAANPDAASLMGINVAAMAVAAFVMSSSLAGMAGLLIAPITTASVFMGLNIALKAFAAAIVGGLTNPRGCVAGGLLLGCVESTVGLWQDEFREISIFALIILVLVTRPAGLFGRLQLEKV
jgi:branched-chain amino acid transport system permease protein